MSIHYFTVNVFRKIKSIQVEKLNAYCNCLNILKSEEYKSFLCYVYLLLHSNVTRINNNY